jgi:hydrogenase expression/formation protein HypE
MTDESESCPLSQTAGDLIMLGHGSGGRLMQDLLTRLVLPIFSNQHLESRHDSAVLDLPSCRQAFTTDSYVINPLFFPGGNIGSLSVCGTLNDLSMVGARPLYLSVGLILEEGLSVSTLETVLRSMADIATQAGVKIVTGDTKVVEKGRCDGIYINTTGLGVVREQAAIGPAFIQPGDLVILSGDIGRHGVSVLAKRESLAIESEIESDCADLSGIVQQLLDVDVCGVHCLRDLTRGGLATALIELSDASGHSIMIEEERVLVNEGVRSFCELLGLDPFFVANEGRFVAVVDPAQANAFLERLHAHPLGRDARVIGEVSSASTSRARTTMRTVYGTERWLFHASGELLPRIC